MTAYYQISPVFITAYHQIIPMLISPVLDYDYGDFTEKPPRPYRNHKNKHHRPPTTRYKNGWSGGSGTSHPRVLYGGKGKPSRPRGKSLNEKTIIEENTSINSIRGGIDTRTYAGYASVATYETS